MDYLTNLSFNPKPSTIMYIDLNSCFATIEQQANPFLRDKPIAVAAYTTDHGCIVAPSVEAKKYGIKTGMRVKDGKQLYPELIILYPDPWKYRNIHLKLRQLFQRYTDKTVPRSIDEFVLDFEGTPIFKRKVLLDIGNELKQKIKETIGEYLTVSVGIAPNRFLAKVASSLQKPDGLNEINLHNHQKIYHNLELRDLPYIKDRNAARLNNQGIFTITQMLEAPVTKLIAAYQSIEGYRWFIRLRGWEIDDVVFGRHSYGNSYSLPKPFALEKELTPILHKLVEKCTARMRKAGYKARGVHLAILYRNRAYWHKALTNSSLLFDSREVYKIAYKLLVRSPYNGNPVANLAVSCFDLLENDSTQLELFSDIVRKENLVKAVDNINQKWGEYVITPAAMLHTTEYVPDRVAFGNIKELEEFTFQNDVYKE